MSSYGTDATVKALSGLSYDDLNFSTDTDFDNFISDLNSQISELINIHLGRDFDLHESEETKLKGTDNYYLMLPHGPLVSVDSVVISDTTIDSDNYQIRPAQNSTYNSRTLEHFYKWWSSATYITVTYDWGFSTTPTAVVRVTENLMLYELRSLKRKQTSGNVDSVSMGGYSISYSDEREVYDRELSKLGMFKGLVLG